MEQTKVIGKKIEHKFNYMKVQNGVFTWKQVEERNGKRFVRIARRPFIRVHGE